MTSGKDLTIISTGGIITECLKSKSFKRKGISNEVLSMHTVKPIDEEAIISSAREIKHIITVEEHNKLGGLGSSVAEVIAKII